mmetsp:Transcript_19167/g.28276  ORF Transcript_19167/g.28276 Transcript_19167/m.28276 type:complete len:318 (+) Transcript_19167:107-1060(+)|eukprot:CAMPEP_0171462698 /NCGR_PEP_ID=MMETSP0945-20130129/6626_1 /TAXON_ID=109269 /ORGANISM="Vaucheria litorea, Strain CCMP2940" /LENGTH=317 /DNA_ID=CAMNT_0011989265 /DNA_START=97 /DNA_END=1050 /DNA_ORIENTATION=+
MVRCFKIPALLFLAVVVASASNLRGEKAIENESACDKVQSECLEYDVCDACFQGMFLPQSLNSKTCDGLMMWTNGVIYDDIEACGPVLEELVLCELNLLASTNGLGYCMEEMFPTQVERKMAVDMEFGIAHRHKHIKKIPTNQVEFGDSPNLQNEPKDIPKLDLQTVTTSNQSTAATSTSTAATSASTAASSTSTSTTSTTTASTASSSPSTFHSFNRNIFTPSDTMMDSSIYSESFLEEDCDGCDHHHDVYHGYNPDIFTPSDSFMDSSYYSDTWSEQDDFAEDLAYSSSYYTSGSFHSSQSGVSDVYSSSFTPFD